MIVSAVSAPLIVEVVLLLPVVVAVGWVAARTLGIRQGWTRIFLTGLIGLALGVSLANWSVVHQPNHEGTLALRIAAFSVLVTMAASIALDFFAKPGGPDRSARVGRLPKLPHPYDGCSERLRRLAASVKCWTLLGGKGYFSLDLPLRLVFPTRSLDLGSAPRSRDAGACSSS
jgi:hypothetical protein